MGKAKYSELIGKEICKQVKVKDHLNGKKTRSIYYDILSTGKYEQRTANCI
jgi:hypothetical protein